MPQAKVYQIDRLRTKIRNSFEFHRSTLEAQRRVEEAEFVNSKIPEIKRKNRGGKTEIRICSLRTKAY